MYVATFFKNPGTIISTAAHELTAISPNSWSDRYTLYSDGDGSFDFPFWDPKDYHAQTALHLVSVTVVIHTKREALWDSHY